MFQEMAEWHPKIPGDILKRQAELARETDPKRRCELWVQQTRQFYAKVAVIRYGDLFGLRAMRTTVKGSNDRTELIRFHARVAGEVSRPEGRSSGGSPTADA